VALVRDNAHRHVRLVLRVATLAHKKENLPRGLALIPTSAFTPPNSRTSLGDILGGTLGSPWVSPSPTFTRVGAQDPETSPSAMGNRVDRVPLVPRRDRQPRELELITAMDPPHTESRVLATSNPGIEPFPSVRFRLLLTLHRSGVKMEL
jgi:hypothetical protein